MLGEEHPSTLTSMNNVALVLSREGSYEEAEQIHRLALASSEGVLGKGTARRVDDSRRYS